MKQMDLVSKVSQAQSTGTVILLFSWSSKIDMQGTSIAWTHSLDAVPRTRGGYLTSPSDRMLRGPSLSERHPHPAIMYRGLCTVFSLIDVAGRVENGNP